MPDVLKVNNFSNKKNISCQSLFDFELVNHFAWYGITVPWGAQKLR